MQIILLPLLLCIQTCYAPLKKKKQKFEIHIAFNKMPFKMIENTKGLTLRKGVVERKLAQNFIK